MRTELVVLLLAMTVPLSGADLELGIRHAGTWITASDRFDGGTLDVVASRGFAATAEVFWTESLSTQLAATFLNPAAILYPAAPPPAEVDLNTLGIDTYSLAARWHLTPRSRWSAFVGGGGAVVSFGNLEERFADDIEMTFESEVAPFVEGGVRYQLLPRLVLDAAVSFMPLEAKPESIRNATNVVLPSSVPLDPLTLSVGAGWRF
jgi:outer membrane protein W